MADLIPALREAFRKDFTQLRKALCEERQWYLDAFEMARPVLVAVGTPAAESVLRHVDARITVLTKEIEESESDDT
jgi:hypothetical protein